MMRYDVGRRVWDVLDIRAEVNRCRCQYMAHPSDDSKVIHIHEGRVSEISLADGAVVKQYNAVYDEWHNNPESVVVGTSDGEFVVFACNGYHEKPWRVFSSADDKWTDTQWPTTNTEARTAFYDPKHNQLYYHIKHEDKFTVVQF